MYECEEITKSSHPKEWARIITAFPSYRKRKAQLVTTKKTTLHGRYWDGGSISRYAILRDGNVIQKPTRNDYPFTAPDEEVDLTDGTCVVQCGVFCGKPGQAYLYRGPK